MNTPKFPPIPYPMRTRPFNTDEFVRLYETGILRADERLELLRGEIIPMVTISSHRADCINLLNMRLAPFLAKHQILVSIHNPILLDTYSMLLPDLAIVRFRPDFYQSRFIIPPDILLLVEVVEAANNFVRDEKMPLFGQTGVMETWLVQVDQGVVEIYRSPNPEGYRDRRNYSGEEQVSPADFPEFTIVVTDLINIHV